MFQIVQQPGWLNKSLIGWDIKNFIKKVRQFAYIGQRAKFPGW